MAQKIGEGWFSRVYLAEHTKTRQEVVLKAMSINQTRGGQGNQYGSEDYDDDNENENVSHDEINSQLQKEFLREYHNACLLSSHANILSAYDVLLQVVNLIALH